MAAVVESVTAVISVPKANLVSSVIVLLPLSQVRRGRSWLEAPVTPISVEPWQLRELIARVLEQAYLSAGADTGFGYALVRRVAGLALDRLQATRLQLLDVYGVGGR